MLDIHKSFLGFICSGSFESWNCILLAKQRVSFHSIYPGKTSNVIQEHYADQKMLSLFYKRGLALITLSECWHCISISYYLCTVRLKKPYLNPVY